MVLVVYLYPPTYAVKYLLYNSQMTKLWIIITLSTYYVTYIALVLSVVDIRIGNLPIVTHIQGGVIWVGNMDDFYN